jgi:mono/diheme cytochrome c family protein
MQVNCNACHSQASPSGGIITSDYENLMVIVNNGKLQGTINHLSGFSPMPKGQNKLPDCDLQKIDAWINDGSPE